MSKPFVYKMSFPEGDCTITKVESPNRVHYNLQGSKPAREQAIACLYTEYPTTEYGTTHIHFEYYSVLFRED